MLPPWGDSVGLPLIGLVTVTVLFSPIAITGIWFLARAAVRQKASLWVWDREAGFNSVLPTAVFIGLLAGLFYLIGSEIVEGSGYFVPMLLLLRLPDLCGPRSVRREFDAE